MIDVALVPFIVAVVVSFITGRLLYGPLLGKQWIRAMGRNEQDMEEAKAKGMFLSMIIALIIRALQVFVLVHMMTMAASYLYGVEVPDVMIAMSTAFWLWLGFILVTHTSERIRDKKINWSLWMINSFSSLLMLLVAALVYVVMLG